MRFTTICSGNSRGHRLRDFRNIEFPGFQYDFISRLQLRDQKSNGICGRISRKIVVIPYLNQSENRPSSLAKVSFINFKASSNLAWSFNIRIETKRSRRNHGKYRETRIQAVSTNQVTSSLSQIKALEYRWIHRKNTNDTCIG